MQTFRTVIFQIGAGIEFVQMPATHAYQLSALNVRLQKEVSKLTAQNVPTLPTLIAECDALELHDPRYPLISGLDYINQLEEAFSRIEEKSYPLISLLTEIRALQAQLEQWYEEENEQ
ncbi:hydrolase/acyltransferase [Marinicrinis sediminis]|uniref:Hydrolase/acyltransferase n=1 Tax=Marinicrinis sediminis TaxID=1652465 RepID=A0ABW5R6Z6_9BACL